jgi:hypothetical protein
VREVTKLTGKKLIILLLYAPTDNDGEHAPIAGRTRLMKMGFLFEEEVWPEFRKDGAFDEATLPKFFAWKYGPFSAQFLDDLEFLINQQYITAKRGDIALPAELSEYEYWVEDVDEFYAREYEEEVFELTKDKGLEKGLELWNQISKNQRKFLKEFKSALTRASLNRILEYVYKKYGKDGYTDKSLIRERYLR